MFGIFGVIIALFVIGSSALANLYNAGKYHDKILPKVIKARDVYQSAVGAFVIDVIVIALIVLL
jgi:hypothetical protein